MARRTGAPRLVAAGLWAFSACGPQEPGGPDDAGLPDAGPTCPPASAPEGLRISELEADNEGHFVDARGETDDWFELVNEGEESLELSGYAISDGASVPVALPARRMAPGQRIVLVADDSPEQGELHLPFKLSAGGDALRLWREDCPVDSVSWTELGENETLARFEGAADELTRCRYATPGKPNGTHCGPAARPDPPRKLYTAYPWPADFSAARGPLAINEMGLRPAAFVEIVNVSDAPVRLRDFVIEVAPLAPGIPYPRAGEGQRLALDGQPASLAPGEYANVPVAAADVGLLEADPAFEGVVGVFAVADGAVSDRVDFMRWPGAALLARQPDASGRLVHCSAATPGAPNDACEPLASRDVGDRLRHLRTPGDFAALAAGDALLGMRAVKAIVDMQADDAVYLISATRWALHYTFVREVIDEEAPLDRCVPAENTAFNAGWWEFTKREYNSSETRRYLLGTLVHHGPSDLHTLEFNSGDAISTEQVRRAFFASAPHLLEPERWAFRPQDDSQRGQAAELEGQLPIVDELAPFAGVSFQPLTQTVGYGVLTLLPSDALQGAALGPRVIVVTDDVPNDIPLVGGLVTSAFQAPLAHVNVLSQSRNTPNMALKGALEDPRIVEHSGELVKLTVDASGFSIETADPKLAEAFWLARAPDGEVLVPRLDLTRRDPLPLAEAGRDDLPAIGAKASQLAELGRVTQGRGDCPRIPLPVPRDGFAVPVVHSTEHLQRSGARDLLEALWNDPVKRGDPAARGAVLAQVRDAIVQQAVDPALLTLVEGAIRERFGSARVRLRSSSNTEDLPGFNGAGIYTSTHVELDDPGRTLQDGLTTVWAGLWNDRAYDERELSRIDHTKVAMGVLVHEAFRDERANGVAVSRNVLDPIRGDIVYLNAQQGEASVTNPAPGVQTEELIYRWPPRTPAISYMGFSSLAGGSLVLFPSEVRSVACAIGAIHDHFEALLNPDGSDRLFAMETEFKFLGDSRTLLIKQGRPHPFRAEDVPADCREF